MNEDEPGICLVLSTVPRELSEKIIHHLVGEGFAACINILPVRSAYLWEGDFCYDHEDLMIIKTSAAKTERLKDEILKMHSYDLPEIIVIPVTGGHIPYLSWVEEKVK